MWHRLVLLSLLAWSSTHVQGQSEPGVPVFADAERRIVYNKQHGLPRYEGVAIRYAYRITTETGWQSAEELRMALHAAFVSVIDAGVDAEGQEVVAWVLTDGNLENHQRYEAFLAAHAESLARSNRSYLLK